MKHFNFALIVVFCFFYRSQNILFAQSKSVTKNSKQTPINQKPKKETTNEEIIDFAKSVLGTPYVYASSDPKVGFDCSGFISYVYNHFKIIVPRSSVDFTDCGEKIEANKVVPGDLILFTGTDSTIRVVGHMGIVVKSEKGKVEFIHSTSGKAHGVTITALNDYYQGRFMMFKRIPLK